MILGALDHVTQWPPQPSSVIGYMVIIGCVGLVMVMPELAPVLIPGLVAGAFGVLTPDSSTEHGQEIAHLHGAVAQVRYEQVMASGSGPPPKGEVEVEAEAEAEVETAPQVEG